MRNKELLRPVHRPAGPRAAVDFGVLAYDAQAAELRTQGKPVTDLGKGDLSPAMFVTPAPLAAFIKRAFEEGKTNYPPVGGVDSLRTIIAQRETRLHHAEGISKSNVIVFPGARAALRAIVEHLVLPGETIAAPIPLWCGDVYPRLVGAALAGIPTSPRDAFHPTAAAVAPVLREARLLMLNSPLNASGRALPRETLRDILRAVVEENRRRRATAARELYVLYDQIYAELLGDRRDHASPLAMVAGAREHVIAVDGIAKSMASTGLGLGWAIVPAALRRPLISALALGGPGAAHPVQAGLADYLAAPATVDQHRAALRKRLRAQAAVLRASLGTLRARGLDVQWIEPDAGLFFSVRLRVPGLTDQDVHRRLLHKGGVAVTPFDAFCVRPGSNWFRLAIGWATPEALAALPAAVFRALWQPRHASVAAARAA